MLAFLLATATVTVDVALLSTLSGSVIPLLVGLVTKLDAPASVKSYLNIALSLVAGIVATLTTNNGSMPLDKLVLATFVALLASDKSYDAIWQHNGAFAAAQNVAPAKGIGKPVTPPEAD